ncbi:SDR family oxidoreductase [Bdellovibrio sp. HCB337]|uniref:SDR family oxidoreductase n=1 Tax=Bdellovibrio sp. HCB337 TaxID=3394358 RepID=UPI0039A743DC
MEKQKILVLGGKGMLGSALVPFLAAQSSWQVFTHSQRERADYTSDLSVYENVKELLLQSRPDYVVNLLALTDVDLCERERELAYKLNVAPLKNLARCSLKDSIPFKLVHISTDHVYDSKLAKESDVKIVNHYALTKYLGDEMAGLCNAVVLRTSFFGVATEKKKSFSDWVLETLKANKPINGFDDIYFSPVHSTTLCQGIERSISQFHPGVYNLGSNQGMSKYEFIVELARLHGLNESLVKPVNYKNVALTTPRPRDMRMDVSAYETKFKVKLPTLHEEIRKC